MPILYNIPVLHEQVSGEKFLAASRPERGIYPISANSLLMDSVAVAIDQINSAVSQMNKVTQQNAAGADRLTAKK